MTWTLVTGGAKRLGAEICTTLAEKGFNILVHYRSSEAEAVEVVNACRKKGVRAEMIAADFSAKEGVAQLLDKIHENAYQIENLINNVGNFTRLTTLNTSLEIWNDLFQTNLHTPFALILGLVSSIKLHRGNIINIGTAGAMDIRADRNANAYMITKRSLYLMTKSLARELAKEQVRVNMVSPGVLVNSVSIPQDPESLPFGRMGMLDEVCQAILFLLDRQNAYITGQNIEVAGGYSL